MIKFHIIDYIKEIDKTVDRYTTFYGMLNDKKDRVLKREVADITKLLLNHKILLEASINQDMPIGLTENLIIN